MASHCPPPAASLAALKGNRFLPQVVQETQLPHRLPRSVAIRLRGPGLLGRVAG
jgi:hypothetical protein